MSNKSSFQKVPSEGHGRDTGKCHGKRNNRGNQVSDRKSKSPPPPAFTLKMESLGALLSFWSVATVEASKTDSFVVKQRATVKAWNLRPAFHLGELSSRDS